MGVIDIIDRKRKEAISFPPQVTVWIVSGLLFSTICLYMFIRLSTDLIEKKTFLFDQKVIDIVQSFSSPVMDGVMLFITDMGSKFMLGLLLVISMIWLFVKRKDVWGMRLLLHYSCRWRAFKSLIKELF